MKGVKGRSLFMAGLLWLLLEKAPLFLLKSFAISFHFPAILLLHLPGISKLETRTHGTGEGLLLVFLILLLFLYVKFIQYVTRT